MIKRFLKWLKDRGSWRMIQRDGEPYLERYLLFSFKGTNLYLHCFWQDDSDIPHCHPWWNMSWIIKGCYIEHFVDETYAIRIKGDKVFRSANSFHRIELLTEEDRGKVWSLFFTWRRIRRWGFLTNKGWIPAGEYSNQDVQIYGKDFITKGVFFPILVELRR